MLDIVEGIAKPIRPEDCIGDGACMLACPTKAIFLMSKCNPSSPPQAVQPRCLDRHNAKLSCSRSSYLIAQDLAPFL
jgi:ferredoxin